MNEYLKDAIEQYAQYCVEDMDIDDLMNVVKESIIDRLEDLPEIETIAKIEESVYSDVLDEYKADHEKTNKRVN